MNKEGSTLARFVTWAHERGLRQNTLQVTKQVTVRGEQNNMMKLKGGMPSTGCSPRLAGFTLLELLVVMVIIGLLASYVAPRFFDQIGKSEIKATRAQLDAFDKALATYRVDVGHYPTTEQGLKALVERPADEAKWSGPYLAKALPLDPWGHAYVYRLPGDANHDFELLSYGKDGQSGGAGENADISVWDTGR